MTTLLLTKLFIAATTQFGLPPGLLPALCYVESKHDITAYHKDDGKGNSVGICQIKLSSARDMGFKGTEKQLMIPQTNIYYAAKYMQHQLNRYNYNVVKAIISYNIGSAKNLHRTKYSDRVFKQWRRQIWVNSESATR